tara:strand:- start:862 stop:2862 length:2001 start_codon:yes stop_codon:yes gene_type:complete
MKDKLTLLQNFIITDDVKLNHLSSNVGIKKTAEVFGDCKTIVNYKTKLYLNEIETLYKNNFNDLSFHNWLDSETFDWAKTTLKLLQEVETPYVFYLTEDRMFCNTSYEEFSNIMNEVVENNVGAMYIGKIPKYSLTKHPKMSITQNLPAYEDVNNHIYTFESKNSPWGCISIDTIFRKDIFELCLKRIIDSNNYLDILDTDKHGVWPYEQFAKYIGRPHILELGKNWLTTEMPNIKLAVPKKLVVVSDDDFGYALGPEMKISLIQPGRNNLKYLKWSYDSIRKNQGIHEVEICVADDASTDGTWDWCQEMMKKDSNFKAIRNEGPTRLGHTILYDRLVNEVASHDICMIYHADMYLCPGALDSIRDLLKEKTIVSLTRIEPPLHPPGPEKLIFDYGIEPEEFREEQLLSTVKDLTFRKTNPTSDGIFAPWAFWKKDFQEIGGHDPLYAPQSKEDTDIFNRFQLNGIKFIQTWNGFVYHMTCRGSRFADGAKRNPDGQVFMKNRETDEWLKQNQKSTREFIRKWGHFCKHDEFLKPIIPPKYDIGFIINNVNLKLIEVLEPWCSTVYCDECMIPGSTAAGRVVDYIEEENTSFDLHDKFKPFDNEKNNEILVEIDGKTFSDQDYLYINQLSEIIQDSGEKGTFNLGNLSITINNLNTYEKDLIICKR